MTNLILKDESYRLMGACFEVYKEKGCGFHEPIYQECLGMEMEMRGIPAIPKPQLQLEYKGRKLEQHFIPDFICYSQIILELNAVSTLLEEHQAQVFNYLKCTRMPLGLLVNFGHHPRLEYKRVTPLDIWNVRDEEPPDFRA